MREYFKIIELYFQIKKRREASSISKIVLIYLVFELVLTVGGSLGSAGALNDTSISNYEVVGCIPYFVRNYQPKYIYLTHIAWASVGVNSDGTIINDHGLPFQLITSAHSHGVKVILIASNFNSESIDSVLAYHRNEVSNNLLLLVQNGNSDGIMIDFEGIRAINKYTGESNALLLVQLMQTLNETFKKANSNYYVSIAIPHFDFNNVFDCSQLSSHVDSFFIMAFDYYLPMSPTTGALSPLGGGDGYNVKKSVNDYLSLADSKKFILGLPLYGMDWPTENGDKGSKTLGEGTSVFLYDAVKNAQIHGYIWDDETKTPWYRYKEDAHWHQCWFDDVTSLKFKYRLALEKDLRGIGFWAIGYEGEDTDIYTAWIEEKALFLPEKGWEHNEGLIKIAAFFIIIVVLIAFALIVIEWHRKWNT